MIKKIFIIFLALLALLQLLVVATHLFHSDIEKASGEFPLVFWMVFTIVLFQRVDKFAEENESLQKEIAQLKQEREKFEEFLNHTVDSEGGEA
jgi:hypothetical protein